MVAAATKLDRYAHAIGALALHTHNSTYQTHNKADEIFSTRPSGRDKPKGGAAMSTKFLKVGIASAIFGGAFAVLVPGITSASVRPHDFLSHQHTLETQLAMRASELNRLNTDITGAKSLSAAHAATLSTNVSSALTNVNALITKVPTDNTNSELRTDEIAMVKQNRVFAVLAPQVFLTIEADSVASEVTSLQGQEPSLLSAVNGLVGQHGYTNALNRYTNFVKLVNRASLDATDVAARVIAQVPADFPGDTGLFVHANRALLDANIVLAHANYDASIIGLASGGYIGG